MGSTGIRPRFLGDICQSSFLARYMFNTSLSNILNLKLRQVGYHQPGFSQAPLDNPVHLCMPQGWYVDCSEDLQPHPDPNFMTPNISFN